MNYDQYTINMVFGTTNSYNSCRSEGTLLLKSDKKNPDVPSEYEKYLKPTKNCEVNNDKIESVSNKITSKDTSSYDKAVTVFNYLKKTTSYKFYSNTRYGAVGTLSRGYGNCVDMSHLIISVMRASGIPARYVHAKSCTFNSGLVVGHVWAEVHVNGKWYTCDLTSKRNNFGVVNNWYKCSGVTRYISLPF